jgi:ElaB/YqjD/DUF883 family membrane-anchored ribosome-binding protein
MSISDSSTFEQTPRTGAKATATAGAAAPESMKARLEQSAMEVDEKARDAVQSVREVRDTFADALSKSIESHPYTTLAIVGGMAFFAGAIWRRGSA